MIKSLIVAISENYVIGKDNNLIWHLPDDLKFFSKTTSGHFVLMGRKNYESIPAKFRPLPNRTNVIITRQNDFEAENCIVVNSIEKGIKIAEEKGENECFIIGGGEIYKQSLELDMVDKMYITQVKESFDGDTFFPKIDFNQWAKKSEFFHPSDAKHKFGFVISEYIKLK